MNLINFFILQWLFVRLEKYRFVEQVRTDGEFFIGDDDSIIQVRIPYIEFVEHAYYRLRFFAIPLTGWRTRLLFFWEADSIRVSKIKTKIERI